MNPLGKPALTRSQTPLLASLLQKDKPKGSHHHPNQAPWAARRAGATTHRLWAGPWPCSAAPAGSSRSLGLPLSFPPLVWLPASPGSAREPHPLFLHPCPEQLPTARARLGRHQALDHHARQMTGGSRPPVFSCP